MEHARTLVIGYGNRLRGDDGAGPAVAETVASWKIPGVRAFAVCQLMPELIDELKNADHVLFVDASAAPLDVPFTTGTVEPRRLSHALGHQSAPAHLLALTRNLEGRCPNAWILAIRVHSLDFGESITEIAQGHLQEALTWIRGWLEESVASCTQLE